MVASVGGLAIGWSLLNFDEPDIPANTYLEIPPRAAVYDQPAFEVGAEFVAADPLVLPEAGAANAFFAPVAPIDASATFEVAAPYVTGP